MKYELNTSREQLFTKIFLLSLVLLFQFLFFGCSKKDKYHTGAMLVPQQIHQSLKINVLSLKVVSGKETLPNLRAPKKGQKYIAVRIMASNPGTHRGMPSVTFKQIVEAIYINHPSLKKPAKISMKRMFRNLEDYTEANRGIMFETIKPGESITGWLIGTLPKDANPPYIMQVKPSRKVGKVLPVQFELRTM